MEYIKVYYKVFRNGKTFMKCKDTAITILLFCKNTLIGICFLSLFITFSYIVYGSTVDTVYNILPYLKDNNMERSCGGNLVENPINCLILYVTHTLMISVVFIMMYMLCFIICHPYYSAVKKDLRSVDIELGKQFDKN